MKGQFSCGTSGLSKYLRWINDWLLIRPRTCIHKFPSSRLRSSPSSSGTELCAITAMTQSPAIDVVGIGFTSGEISVYDVRADERLMRMFMEGGGVRALGFRSGRCSILALYIYFC